jgi:hypothetical protein
VYVPGKHFQPNLMFVGKARSLRQSGAPQRLLHLLSKFIKLFSL